MSATKAHLMSPAGRAEVDAIARDAERRWANLCAACALARGVDSAVLDDIVLAGAREFAEAQELIAAADAY